MSYTHYWEWDTCIANANLFAAWSSDIAHLQTYMATPGKLLPLGSPCGCAKIGIGPL